MRAILPYLKSQWRALAGTFAAATIGQLLLLVDPQILRLIIDRYVMKLAQIPREAFFRGVFTLIGASIGVALLSRVFRNLQEYEINLIARRAGARLYAKSIAHSLLLPFRVFEDQRSGELLHTIQRARTDAETAITNGVRLYLGILAVTAVTIYAFTVNWIIGTMHLLLVPVVTLLTLLISSPIRKQQRAITGQSAALAGSTTETIRNVELVKSLGIETQEIGRLHAVNDRILVLEEKKIRLMRTIIFFEGTLMHLTRASLLVVMLWLVYDRQITTGQFLSLFLYSGIIFSPLAEIGTAIGRYQEARATFDTLDVVLDKPVEAKSAGGVQPGELRKIAFDAVTLQYTPNHPAALKDIHIELRDGETVAFVGPSGSGKSSLVKLLVGLYTPTEGALTVNGRDLRTIDLDIYRARIGLVTHDTQLFAGTIRENLLLVKPDASDEQCISAMTRAAALTILERGGEGLDTRIGEGGIKLSGGERQRIAIARALLRAPELIVFDEATSNLDSITERAITATIRDVARYAGARITVVVAHRLSTVAHADRILVLAHGEIVESGTHTELLTRDGLYAAMWREQSGIAPALGAIG
jgi:ATP-binding cassette, subfamily B, bacterial